MTCMTMLRRVAVFVLLIVAGLFASAPAEAFDLGSCPQDIALYWRFEEPSGTTFSDSVGGYDASCAGGILCPSSTTGIVGNALLFDGSDDFVIVPAVSPALAPFDWAAGDSFTIEFWVKTNSASTCAGNQVMVGRDDPSTDLHWWAGCLDGGTPAFFLFDKSNAGAGVVGSTDVTDGEWHHVAVVRDGSAGETRLYVNGVLEDTVSHTYSSGFDSATADVNMGWLNLSSGFRFSGAIDEMAFYSRALSLAEIQQNRSNGLAGKDYCSAVATEIEVTDPDSGDSVPSGSVYDIRWNAPADAVDFKVKYSCNGGFSWAPAQGTLSGNSFAWEVPTPRKNKTKCLVKVIGFDAQSQRVGADNSELFMVETASITSPAAGETLTGGGSHLVTWTTNGTKAPVESYKLKYSLNRGRTWRLLGSGIGNPGSHDWSPLPDPSVPKVDKVRLKLFLKDASGKTVAVAVSDLFTID